MEVHRLLEKGHDPNTEHRRVDAEGRTRLIMATNGGEKEVAAELLNYGRLTDLATYSGRRTVLVPVSIVLD